MIYVYATFLSTSFITTSRVVATNDLDLAVTDRTAYADHLKGTYSGVQGYGMLSQ